MKEKMMFFIEVGALVIGLYLIVCIVISLVKVIHRKIKGKNTKGVVKETFLAVFLEVILEMINPFNWI
ncbi:hypothetical protein [Miniphocaeibacter massiliensis]|uniref:hypothetical protein n=1 Tax=Miniphocaeibacter massiliensis TaxID=2041841 RepID=UPI000C06F11B|nr:hypothetical protein [Miniphocaeibacter massiliensis]